MPKFTLEQVQERFPKSNYGSIYFEYDYVDDNLGTELVHVRDNDYQGETRILLRDGNRYAIRIYSWGSCSGCDFMQACETYEEFLDYANNAYDSLEWIGKDDMMVRLNDLLAEERANSYKNDEDILFYEKAISVLEVSRNE